MSGFIDERTALEIVDNYLRTHGCTPKRLSSSKKAGQKTPDFEIYIENRVEFICEIKTPKLLRNPLTKIFNWNTTVSKIREHSSKAYKQFLSYDKNHAYPWALFFISSHPQLNWKNMLDSLCGTITVGKLIIKDLRNQRFIKATQSEINNIDFFVWIQVNPRRKKIYQLVNFMNLNSRFIKKIRTIIKRLIPYEDEDILDINAKKYRRIRKKF